MSSPHLLVILVLDFRQACTVLTTLWSHKTEASISRFQIFGKSSGWIWEYYRYSSPVEQVLYVYVMSYHCQGDTRWIFRHVILQFFSATYLHIKKKKKNKKKNFPYYNSPLKVESSTSTKCVWCLRYPVTLFLSHLALIIITYVLEFWNGAKLFRWHWVFD